MKAKFVVKRNKAGEFYFNLHAENGEIIATSESYTTRRACYNGIAAVKRCAYGAVDVVDQSVEEPQIEAKPKPKIEPKVEAEDIEVVDEEVVEGGNEITKDDLMALKRSTLNEKAEELGLNPKDYSNKDEISDAILTKLAE